VRPSSNRAVWGSRNSDLRQRREEGLWGLDRKRLRRLTREEGMAEEKGRKTEKKREMGSAAGPGPGKGRVPVHTGNSGGEDDPTSQEAGGSGYLNEDSSTWRTIKDT
jgi:hypothetical protein